MLNLYEMAKKDQSIDNPKYTSKVKNSLQKTIFMNQIKLKFLKLLKTNFQKLLKNWSAL